MGRVSTGDFSQRISQFSVNPVILQMPTASWRLEVSLIEKHSELHRPRAEEVTCAGDPGAVHRGSQNIPDVSQRECPNFRDLMIKVHLSSQRKLQQVLPQLLHALYPETVPSDGRRSAQDQSPGSWSHAWLWPPGTRVCILDFTDVLGVPLPSLPISLVFPIGCLQHLRTE